MKIKAGLLLGIVLVISGIGTVYADDPVTFMYSPPPTTPLSCISDEEVSNKIKKLKKAIKELIQINYIMARKIKKQDQKIANLQKEIRELKEKLKTATTLYRKRLKTSLHRYQTKKIRKSIKTSANTSANTVMTVSDYNPSAKNIQNTQYVIGAFTKYNDSKIEKIYNSIKPLIEAGITIKGYISPRKHYLILFVEGDIDKYADILKSSGFKDYFKSKKKLTGIEIKDFNTLKQIVERSPLYRTDKGVINV